jgi:hypothetical protein
MIKHAMCKMVSDSDHEAESRRQREAHEGKDEGGMKTLGGEK